MKRLTWALLSLMLFFGMGTAFADVETPVITPSSGSAVTIGDKVTITCETQGATIHYAYLSATKFDVTESDPVYTEPFALTESMISSSGKITIMATAFKDGEESWPAAKAIYTEITIPGAEPEEIAKPVITPASGSAVTIGQTMVTITCETQGATIRYTTDGSGVSETSDIYTVPFALTESMISRTEKITITAMAYKDGKESEYPAKAIYSDITILTPPTPAITVAQPVITPDNSVGKIKLNEKVTITCATSGASIYYTLDGSVPTAESTLYEAPFLLPETTPVDQEITIRAIAIKDGVSSDPRRVDLLVEEAGEGPEDPVTPPAPITKPNAPTFEIDGEEVTAATLEVSTAKVEVKWIGDETSEDYTVVYTLDGSEAVFAATNMGDEVLEDANYWQFGDEAFDVTVPATIKARVAAADMSSGDITWSDMVTLELTFVVEAPVTLTFTPASGSEVEEGTAVTIVANQDVDIFYMMFESEEAAKAAEWDQEKAESYSDELKPVLSLEKTTIKAAYAYPDAEALAEGFFYATYTVLELPLITLTFDPASGSEVEEGTAITVTANRETEIFYNLYADKEAADADTLFMTTAKEVEEDGKPVITKDNTYLRCAVTDRGEMNYIDAVYTLKVANEDEELAGVTVYPNPSNGEFNLELPVAATVEVFAINGVLMQRMEATAGNTTLTINRNGIYFLRITGDGRTAIKRVIVNQ